MYYYYLIDKKFLMEFVTTNLNIPDLTFLTGTIIINNSQAIMVFLEFFIATLFLGLNNAQLTTASKIAINVFLMMTKSQKTQSIKN